MGHDMTKDVGDTTKPVGGPDELRKAIDKLLPLDEFDYEKAEAWNAGRAAAQRRGGGTQETDDD
jgi:hypothetical protein